MPDKTGIAVKYFDPYSKVHDALITNDWNKDGFGAVNLVLVSKDPNMTDQYGSQLSRPTSVAHIKQGGGYEKIMANCWCLVEEYPEFADKIPQR